MKRLFAVAIAAAFFTLSPLAAQAAEPARLPVIVVFKDNLPSYQFQPLFRLDARMQANPELWAYLDKGLLGMVQQLEQRLQFSARHVYSNALSGFAAQLTAQQIAALESDPTIDYVEADGVMHTTAQVLPWGVDKVDADLSSAHAGNGSGMVSGVNAYVIDTGVGGLVLSSGLDLSVKKRLNFVSSEPGVVRDGVGHGTHVAGTLAALDNLADMVGVAPGVSINSVRVLDSNGYGAASDIVKGIDWVTANAVKPAVANMSLGGSVQQALDDAVKRSVAKGIFYAIAAGNSNADACKQSPARAGGGTDNGIMTTAATDKNDAAAWFSNYGRCVDVWAPGVDILSLSPSGTATMSGTSMASPHVAGAAALYLSRHPTATPTQVEAAIRNATAVPGTKAQDGAAIRRLNVAGF